MTASTHRSRTSIVVAILALVGLVATLAQPVSAGTEPSSSLASRLFATIAGDGAPLVFSIDGVLHTPEGTYVGTEGLADYEADLTASFSNIDFALRSVVEASDGHLVATYTMTALNTGTYRGIAATCAGISVPAVALLKVESRTFLTESWSSGTDDVRLDLPDVQSVNVVTEQWISYDAGLLASQIFQHGNVDPRAVSGCGVSLQPGEWPAGTDAPSWEPAPHCPNPTSCALPY